MIAQLKTMTSIQCTVFSYAVNVGCIEIMKDNPIAVTFQCCNFVFVYSMVLNGQNVNIVQVSYRCLLGDLIEVTLTNFN